MNVEQRFTVGSVTGYPSTIDRPRKNHLRTVWYVHDSAYCYRTVAEFRGMNAEQRARKVAKALNAGRELGPKLKVGLEPGDPRHGTISGYAYHGCRCKACKAVAVQRNREGRARRRSKAAATAETPR